MPSGLLKLALATGAMSLAASFALPATASAHWHKHHRYHYSRYDRPLTVHRHHAPVVAVAPDPYNGPNAIVTGPNAVASTIVSLPFRAVNSIFPPVGNTPLVIVGAPTYAAAHVAQVPFYVVGTVFGAPPNPIY